MKKILQRLAEHQTLTKKEAKEALYAISKGEVNNSQIAAFLTVFMMRSITVDELSGFRETLQELCLPVDFSDFYTIDLCGTGGDSKNTFNISTLSSLVVAGAGEKVAKHGNYSVSSSCGSSNVMEYFGYKFTDDVDKLKNQIDKHNICFLHAPLFHPAMKAVAPIRRELGMKTFFNVLGPIINPSKPKNQMAGVYNLETMRMYNYILQQTDTNYIIIHSLDGYDEISLTGDFKITTNVTEEVMRPEDLGFRQLKEEELFAGHSVKEAAEIFESVLTGQGTEAQNNAVLSNAGMALKCVRNSKTLEGCIEDARESLMGGKALNVLKQITN
ncbi:anthranilate phosphoribosyltransferase [Saccharicrinis sp. FJH62]|uniref:anthranilate phosphoribosyltransferase n=1 Tax=Saccharicrinis sp. FJH62 TaxID=3344657 RepID=UPI0035D4B217